jgi:hypothetical protein
MITDGTPSTMGTVSGFVTSFANDVGPPQLGVRCTRESQKLSALLFFQFIYTEVGVEQVRHFLHSLLPFRCTWSSRPQA